MPLRPINREQSWLLPPTLDELIPDDHPARFVASFVDTLSDKEWQKLNIEPEGELLGAPAYHPRCLLSVWLFGFMTGTRSSRKLEAACRDQIPYLWLTGWQRPDHNTLWRFYKVHRDKMHDLLKKTVKTAIKMDLVDLAVQAVDGTRISGNAAKDRTYDAKGLQKLNEKIEKQIREMERENEENKDAPPVHLPEKLRQAEQLKKEVRAAMSSLEEEDRKRINLTDGDTELMKGRQGYVAGYNLEAVASPVDGNGKSGLLITAVDVVNQASDAKELVPMLEKAEENTGIKADITLADGGFHSGANLGDCEKREQIVVMPEVQNKALNWPYHKDKFSYDHINDKYLCPRGQSLNFVESKLRRDTLVRIYRGSGGVCRKCAAFGVCTQNRRHGRELQIGEHDDALRRHRVWMSTSEAKEAYKKRKEIIEPVFGILKEAMGVRRFLLRGLENVRAEANMLAIAFNLRTLCKVWKSLVVYKTAGRMFNELLSQKNCVIFAGWNLFYTA